MRCKDWCEPADPVAVTDGIEYGMKRDSEGFYIDCAHCRKEFESLGLRCCAGECDHEPTASELGDCRTWQYEWRRHLKGV